MKVWILLWVCFPSCAGWLIGDMVLPQSDLAPPAWVVLGVAQDAGFPQLGCSKSCCQGKIRSGEKERVASAALVGKTGWWLVDATPDMVEQIHTMGEMPQGIFLTHAHMGHYTGLMQLGFESMNADGMPVYCSRSMAGFLRHNGPWNQLVEMGQIILHEVGANQRISLEPGLSAKPMSVQHRSEYTNTFAWSFQQKGGKSVLWLPDIDAWNSQASDLLRWVTEYDHAFLDGTFFSADELPGRDMSQVKHPRVADTLHILQGQPHQGVHFIHLNHTNPLWNTQSVASQKTRASGCTVPRAQQVYSLR